MPAIALVGIAVVGWLVFGGGGSASPHRAAQTPPANPYATEIPLPFGKVFNTPREADIDAADASTEARRRAFVDALNRLAPDAIAFVLVGDVLEIDYRGAATDGYTCVAARWAAWYARELIRLDFRGARCGNGAAEPAPDVDGRIRLELVADRAGEVVHDLDVGITAPNDMPGALQVIAAQGTCGAPLLGRVRARLAKAHLIEPATKLGLVRLACSVDPGELSLR